MNVVQFLPNHEWISINPESGVLQPGFGNELDLTLYASGDDWKFPEGRFQAQLRFVHNGRGGFDEIPIELDIRPSSTDQEAGEVLATFITLDLYPQPFNGMVSIEYSLRTKALTRLEVFDNTGRKLLDRDLGLSSPGSYKYTLQAGDLSAGVYFVKLQAGIASATAKVVLIK